MTDRVRLIGEWAAIHDEAYWAPLAGIVSRIASAFGFRPGHAGEFLVAGLVDGQISAIDPATGHVVRLGGDMVQDWINWTDGALHQPGLPPIPLVIYWPDVEAAAGRRAALEAIAAERVDSAIAARAVPSSLRIRRRTGPQPYVSATVEDKMRAELAAGTLTLRQLEGMKKIQLPLRFGGKETTCWQAKQRVLQTATNSDQVLTNDN